MGYCCGLITANGQVYEPYLFGTIELPTALIGMAYTPCYKSFKKFIMSNLILNIRFWYWHLQIGKQFKSCKIVRNNSIDTLKNIPKIQVFKFFNCL